jgi:phosphate transport system protein
MNVQTRRTLDRDLQAIHDDILRLGKMVDSAISQSMQALADRDTQLAESIVQGDEKLNNLRYQIEEACLALVATQQPAAGDLRNIMAAMSIVSDLERMGDHAEGIARIVIRMDDQPLLKPLIDLPRMAEICRKMLSQSLEAYMECDAEKALEVASQDDAIDDLYNQVFRELLSFMLEDPNTVTRALYLQFASHNLERIADRVTNIAERVVFMASGEILELNPEPDTASLT